MNEGSWWRGRRMAWDPDKQAIEQERQRWVYEKISGEAALVAELAVDPDQAYREWRREYETRGDPAALRMMLEYVR